MRKHLTKILLSGGVAALAVGIGATTAMAVTAATFTVTPGGAVTGSAGKTTLKDTKTGTVLTCSVVGNRGHPEEGQRAVRQRPRQDHVCHVHQVHRPRRPGIHRDDVGVEDPPVEAERQQFQRRRDQGKHHRHHGQHQRQRMHRDRGRHHRLLSGKTTGTYTNSTHVLKVSGGNLHVWNVSSGCLGLINSGDASRSTGSYTITPHQTITSP